MPKILIPALLGSTILLTGCQAAPAGLEHMVEVSSLPSAELPAAVPAPAEVRVPDETFGLDLRFGPSTIGISCATESVTRDSGGTTAMICNWGSTQGATL